MKKALVWIRDHIVSGVIVAVLTAWLAPPSLEGLFSTAVQSWNALGSWTVDPIAVPRWQLLIVLGVVPVYAIGLVAYVVRANARTENAVSEAFTGMADTFNKAAKDIEPKQPTPMPDNVGVPAPELDPVQKSILEYLARRHSAGKDPAASRDIARDLNLPPLRTEQMLDQLVELGMISRFLNMITGTSYILGRKGRDWLLANGFE
ncbi:hypothetical protein D9M70_390960 [compost metagenome]